MDKLKEKFIELSNSDPEKAIKEARKLSNDINSQILKGSILIDCGLATKDRVSINEGVSIARTVLEKYPDNAFVKYNLANGLHALSQATEYDGPNWYPNTHIIRRDARKLFNDVAKLRDGEEELTSQCYTNFANILNSSYRWVEAFDAYNDALKYESYNGVASSGAAKILKYCLDVGIGDPETTKRSINRFSTITKRSTVNILKYAGKEALDSINSGIEFYDVKDEEVFELDKYESFVAEHRLALSLNINGISADTKRWDDLQIHSVRVGKEGAHRVPQIFAMFNILKSDYLLARWLAYCALNEVIPDSGFYSDTLDYANYGTRFSTLSLAQRSAIDVLDKLTVASLEYFDMSGAKNANFKTSWFIKNNKSTPRWKERISREILDGNVALIALTELAKDFSDEEAYLKSVRLLRNASTHRFVALHDMGNVNEIKSKSVEHYNLGDFTSSLIETLRVVRSSLIYLVEMIAYSETTKSRNDTGFIGHLNVPSHHYVRGEDGDFGDV